MSPTQRPKLASAGLSVATESVAVESGGVGSELMVSALFLGSVSQLLAARLWANINSVSKAVRPVMAAISRYKTLLSKLDGIINPGKAITAKIFNTLEPMIFPTAIS